VQHAPSYGNPQQQLENKAEAWLRRWFEMGVDRGRLGLPDPAEPVLGTATTDELAAYRSGRDRGRALRSALLFLMPRQPIE
jgi:hypothetical protein